MTTPTRAAISNLPPYSLAEPVPAGVPRAVLLAQNELGTPPSPRAMAAAAGAVADLNRYADPDHGLLRQAIADCHGLDPAGIVCGVGSMELMGLLALAYGEPGAAVVVSQFGYKYFQLQCALAGATIKVVPEPGMRADVDAMAAAVGDRTRLVFLVNPNNPTGTLLEAGEVRRLRRLLPDHVMLILDGAYAEFVDDPDYETGFAMVDRGENVVVLRTFSKAHGLAGLRVGWLYGPSDVVAAITAVRAPNSVTASALAAAVAAIADQDHVRAVRQDIARRREAFRATLTELGLKPLPSATNFVLVACPPEVLGGADGIFQGLKQRGIVTRPMGSYGLPAHIRITIGSAEDMAYLDEVLREMAKAAHQ